MKTPRLGIKAVTNDILENTFEKSVCFFFQYFQEAPVCKCVAIPQWVVFPAPACAPISGDRR